MTPQDRQLISTARDDAGRALEVLQPLRSETRMKVERAMSLLIEARTELENALKDAVDD